MTTTVKIKVFRLILVKNGQTVEIGVLRLKLVEIGVSCLELAKNDQGRNWHFPSKIDQKLPKRPKLAKNQFQAAFKIGSGF